VQLGLPLSVALDNSVERIQNDDWAFIVTSINIQAEVGGNLAEILQTVGDTIRERVRIVGEIRVLTTQQRLTGWILSLLPVFLLVVMFIISPDYMRGLPIALGLMGAAGIIVGAMLLRRIVDIEV
jgi:tight adherence protein B